MIKRVSTILLAFACTAYVSAQDVGRSPFYAKVEGGVSFPTHKLNNQFYHSAKPPHFMFLGAGLGYIINENFRSDVTLTFRPTSRLMHSRRYIEDGADHTEEIHQDFSHNTLMFNGYYNLQKFGSFSPYISAGIGISRNHLGEYFSRDVNPAEPTERIIASSGRSTKFTPAWSIGVGTNLGISTNFDLDIFYRYVNLGNAKKTTITQTIYPANITNTYTNNPGKLKNHETGIGFTARF